MEPIKKISNFKEFQRSSKFLSQIFTERERENGRIKKKGSKNMERGETRVNRLGSKRGTGGIGGNVGRFR